MKIKQYIFAVIALGFLASCSNTPVPVDCKQYKNGKFRFSTNYEGKRIHYIIDRNNGAQTEECTELGFVGNFKVSWKDDCTYQLVYLNGKDNLPAELENEKRKTVLQTTILSGTENYYLFEATSNRDNRVMKDTMWVIK